MWASLALLAQIQLPFLEQPAKIDGNLAEWREYAHHDGVWDIHRLRAAPWYDPRANRLTVHGTEPAAEDDLSARYFAAWSREYLYLGAEVRDNVNDVTDPKHEPKRWYYKDAICWFIEAPRDQTPEKFAQGDNAFCFVIDARRPPYAAWWRHGAPGKTYVEEPLPASAVEWSLRMNPWKRSRADFVLEARVKLAATFAVSDPSWRAPREGDEWSMEIVHTDPDGGDYGGHFLVHGNGDDDSTWTPVRLAGPKEPVQRLPK